MSEKDWWQCNIKIERNFEDLLIWKFTEIGINSYAFNCDKTNQNSIQAVVWLPKYYWNKSKRDKFENELSEFINKNGYQPRKFIWDQIKEANWLNNWKKYWKPELIGNDFLVLPYWMEVNKKYQTRKVIKINPGAAFGTGGHPSTALCIESMENTFLNDKKVLDIGCGSGILSIAAKKLGAKEIYSIDNDYLAINATKENIEINFVSYHNFHISEGSFPSIIKNLELTNFDFICCNIIANVIKGIIPHLYHCLNSKGIILLSGILSSQESEIIKLLNLYHFKADNVLSKQDWISIKASKL